MLVLVLVLVLAACVPDIDVDLARVDAPAVLAVRAEPAEAEPGEDVTMTALLADGDGVIAEGPSSWAFCLARRPLAELGPIARACLDTDAGDAITQLGGGPSVVAAVPDDTCRRFGPDPPEAAPGEPTGRPVDPDLTGGYYQPVVVRDDAAELAILQLRITCGVASATQQQAAELRRRYQANRAPEPLVLELAEGGALPATVAAGARLDLRVRWAACPDVPVCGDGMCTLDEAACTDDCDGVLGCPGAEHYLRFDPLALAIERARESIGIAWYGTDGSFDEARTGRDTDEQVSFGDNGWTAPDRAGTVMLWVVLRDDRGGVAWREQTIEVVQ